MEAAEQRGGGPGEQHPVPAVQVELRGGMRAEKATNTTEDWEAQVAAILEEHGRLEGEYSSLVRKQEEEEQEHSKMKLQLEQRKREAVLQHQALLDKMESVRVKLQLNDSKASRKNFLSKKQEMMSEKSRAEEETYRLDKELQEVEEKLGSLEEAQQQEKGLWGQELGQLTAQLGQAQKEAEEAQRVALQDEVAAVETQRETAMFCIDAWLKEVGQYLAALPLENSQQLWQQRLRWEKQEAAVRRSREEVDARFQELLQQLQRGRGFESLPRPELPPLPRVPTVELAIPHVLLSLDQTCCPPPAAPYRATPPPRFSTPPPPDPVTPPRSSSSPAPADKLDKLLEKLGARFPQCTRLQLMAVLKQIKSERSTMAGMSMEEVAEQVGLLLAHGERPGPVGRPVHGGAAQPAGHKPTYPLLRSGPCGLVAGARAPGRAPAGGARRHCLMCQNQVEPSNQHPLNCSHVLHRDCISLWLQSSGNNCCPFCPAGGGGGGGGGGRGR